ncbi:MAG: hypothetical protein MJE68_22615 [Proteobacteria bacterium]|nr:hypothetical protein [Pseudomonadota bacterium]
MEHTRSIDTDEVEKCSTKEVEKDEASSETAISADPLGLIQSTSYGVRGVLLYRTTCPVGKK